MKGKIFLSLVVLIVHCAPISAQTVTPTTEQMIEQLKAPRIRNLRNLMIEAAPSTPNEALVAPIPGTAQVPGSQATLAAAAQSSAATAPRPPSLSLLIQFDFDSATIRPESQQALMNLVQALQSPELKESVFAIEGHTDAKGRIDYNLRLSEQRALAVKRFLAQQGVIASRLSASGKGSTQLANPSRPYAAENRRVRIVNLD